MIIGIDAHNLEGNRTGVGRYLTNLLQQWSKFNVKCQMSNVKFNLYFKDEIPDDLPRSSLFETKLLKVGSTAKFIHWDLWRQAQKDKVDILFCPGYIAPIFWRGKLALTLHDIIYQAHPKCFEWQSWADRILLKWVSKISAKKAKIIFTISQFSRQEIIQHFGVTPEKIKLTYLGADLEPSTAESDNDTVKNHIGLKSRFVFYVGYIFNRRHLPEIIAAFFKIVKEYPDFQLLLSGKDHTSPSQNIDGLIVSANQKLGSQAILRLDFLPENDLKLLYSASAFFIYLSDYEGFGLPVLEAMSLGTPVVTSDSSSLKEVAGEAALLIKNNGDVEEIYQAMKKLVDDNALKSQLIKKGREQAKKFSWEKCAKNTLDTLLSI